MSNWDLLWPFKMLIDGGLGDKAIVIAWVVILIIGLN
jgi:hypothetical protein